MEPQPLAGSADDVRGCVVERAFRPASQPNLTRALAPEVRKNGRGPHFGLN